MTSLDLLESNSALLEACRVDASEIEVTRDLFPPATPRFQPRTTPVIVAHASITRIVTLTLFN